MHRMINLHSASKIEQTDIQWAVQQWHLAKISQSIRSNPFALSGYPFNYLSFDYIQNQNTYVLRCSLRQAIPRNVHIKAFIFVENEKNHELKNIEEKNPYSEGGYKYYRHSFTVEEKLLNKNNYNLVFNIEFSYVLQENDANIDINRYCVIEKVCKAISDDYDMINRNEESFLIGDITFSIGSTKMKAHSMILAAASSYFAAIFRHKDFKENRERTITLTDDNDVTPENFKIFLDIIYGRETITNVKHDFLTQICVLADKYSVEELLNSCELILSYTLTKENVIKFLLFADKYNCKFLKAKALMCVKQNLNAVKQAPNFDDLYNNKPLLLELL